MKCQIFAVLLVLSFPVLAKDDYTTLCQADWGNDIVRATHPVSLACANSKKYGPTSINEMIEITYNDDEQGGRCEGVCNCHGDDCGISIVEDWSCTWQLNQLKTTLKTDKC